MTDAQYVAYRSTAEDGYARQVAESGAMSWAAAVEKAAADFARLLPKGLGTPDAHLFTAVQGDDEVGMLWLQLETAADGRHAFVYDIEVRPEYRRAGHGRAIMLAGEDFARTQGRGVDRAERVRAEHRGAGAVRGSGLRDGLGADAQAPAVTAVRSAYDVTLRRMFVMLARW
jgi:ribosomal protein S18 acetylase RimI-like enzyme